MNPGAEYIDLSDKNIYVLDDIAVEIGKFHMLKDLNLENNKMT